MKVISSTFSAFFKVNKSTVWYARSVSRAVKGEESGFGELIARLRKRAGMEQEDFAKAVGVSVKSVSHWENNHSAPKLPKWRRIFEVAGLRIEDCLYMPEDVSKYRALEVEFDRKTGGRGPRDDNGGNDRETG